MNTGRLRHVRATVYIQAALVWGLQKVDGKAWIENGQIHTKGEPATLPADQEKAVNDYVKKIEQAGGFVMPEA